MPSSLKALIDLLKRSRNGILPSIQSFPHLDINQIARELRIDTRGIENGKYNIPLPDSDSEDNTENEIIADIRARVFKANEEYLSQLEIYESRIRSSSNIFGKKAEIIASGEQALIDFKVQKKDDLDHLNNALLEFQGREREFKAYKEEHKLERLPIRISPRELLFRWIIIAIFIVIESFVNGNLFAKGSTTGLIGGFIEAFLFSLLNIGTATFYTLKVMPLISYKKATGKIMGIIGSLIYFVWAIGLNIFIGHYRDSFAISDGAAVRLKDVFAKLKSGIFSFSEAQSLLLFGLGLGFCILAIIDAYKMSDPYLRYGAIGKRREKAQEEYACLKTECFEQLSETRTTAIDDMLSTIEIIRSEESAGSLAIDGRSRLHKNYCNYLKHLNDCLEALIQRYREINIKNRTLPPPSRFSRKFDKIDFLNDPNPLIAISIDNSETKECIEKIQYFIVELNRQYGAAVDEYKSISEI